MKYLIKIAAMLALITMAGCSHDDKNQDNKPAKTTGTELLKTQRETLEKSKQVEQMLEDAAEQQRQDIDQSTQ